MSNELDKFYTADDVVTDCISSWEKNLKIKEKDFVVECSAGGGAFLNHLSSYNVKAFDILPEADGIIKQDFLKLNLEKEFGKKKLHFVSNVPFGKGSSLANKFIKHCTDHSSTKSMSFILPASHSRPYLMNKVNKFFHLKHQHFCQDFVEFGKSQKINCVFQIWVRKSYERELINMRPTTSLISFTSKENATHKIGNKARTGKIYKIDTDTKQKKIASSSFIYIKFNDAFLEKTCNKYEGYLIHSVNKNEFIACPNTTKMEVVNGMEKIMEAILNKHKC